MMSGLMLSENAPLFGRAAEFFKLEPLEPQWLSQAFPKASAHELLNAFTAWGGIPRYWELAANLGVPTLEALQTLVLDPQGVLHHEPSRLLLEEIPTAAEARPLLDAIGSGAARLSEFAGRLGRPATSLARPIERLIEMSLVAREVPFGESEQTSKKTLYRLTDPFFRLWFRIVAPNRGLFETDSSSRAQILQTHWPALRALAFEQLCRQRLPLVESLSGQRFGRCSRWWQGNQPEWDLVSESSDGTTLLFGEARALEKPLTASALRHEAKRLAARPLPPLGAALSKRRVMRALFVPEVGSGVPPQADGVLTVTLATLGIRPHSHRRK
jgi:AAA+ ATPase superfamily predicted ATPase